MFDEEILTFKRQLALLLVGYLCVAGGEIVIHWLLAQPYCRSLLNIYLTTDVIGRSRYFYSDLILPAGLLGYWNGRLDRKSPSRAGIWFAIPLAAGVVALYPLNRFLIGHAMYWWPQNILSALFLFVRSTITGAVIILGLTQWLGDVGVPKHLR
jgi:hypothetical protein